MSDRKRKEASLTIKLNRIVTDICALCKTGLVVKHHKRELSLGKLIDIAFALRKVLCVTDDWLQSTFNQIFKGISSSGSVNSEPLLCSECLRSVSEITVVIEELVDLSGDIVNLKRNFFPGNRKRRLFIINCDENEHVPEEIQSEVEDPLGDGFTEAIEASDNESDSEEPQEPLPKRPCLTKTVRKVKPRCSGTSGPRRNAVKLICPVCKSFKVPSDKYVELCSHLHTCYGTESTSLTCLSCNDYETTDFQKYSEHVGFCRGVKDDEIAGVIPIKSRIICCEKCPGPKYFNFEKYLDHYVYHLGRQYQCSFSGCGVLKTTSNIINGHWKSHHKSDWATTPALKRFTIDKSLPSIPWFCPLCEDRFENVDDRNAHLVNQHSFVNTDSIQTCKKCSFTYSFREDLLIHKAVQHSPVETSDEGAATTGEERETAQDPSKKELPPVNCPICKSFAVSPDKCDEMYQHLNTSHGEKRGEKLKCKLCKVYTSNDFQEFAEHVGYCQTNQDSGGSLTNLVVPINKRLICCDKCPGGKCFTFDRYIAHVKHHLSNPFKCMHQGETPCQKTAANKNSINSHWLHRHKSDPIYGNQRVPPSARYKFDGTLPKVPWFCHHCNSRFESVDVRDVHLSEKHSLIPHQAAKTCDAEDNCNFQYFLDEDLLVHEVFDHTPRVHHKSSEGKPETVVVTCPVCKTFKVASDNCDKLYQHLLRDHGENSEKDLKCTICDAFKTKSFQAFAEHVGCCPENLETGERSLKDIVIPIRKRLICCDQCPGEKCFTFDGFLDHYKYHLSHPFKCIHNAGHGATPCHSRGTNKNSINTHWLHRHKCDPVYNAESVPVVDRFKFDDTPPSIPWFCELCNSRFPSVDERGAHLAGQHSGHVQLLGPGKTCGASESCHFKYNLEEDFLIHDAIVHRPRVQNEDLKIPQLKEKKPTKFSELLCPCCKQTSPKYRNVGGRTGNSTYANLCRHLVSCPERTPTLQCDKCDFQSEDIRLFCEHLGGCDGQPGNVIPIDKRIISCNLCPEGTFFSFEAYFKHCVYHKRNSYKCLFPDPSTPSGLCSERTCASVKGRHWLKHISDPRAGQISSEDRFKLDPEVPPLYWFCHLCNDRFLSEDDRNSHLTSEHTLVLKRLHQCNNCPSNFLITEDLSMHSILEHPEFAEGFSFLVKCDHCGDIFRSKKVLQQHIKSSHENCSMPCPKCDQSFNSQKDYIDHMKTHGVHLKNKHLRHLCPECNLPFQQPINLTSHRIRQHDRTDLGADPLVCVPCKKTYSSLSSLQMHNSLVHERKSVTFCDKCGRQLKSKLSLKRHLISFHGEGDLPTFKCEYSDCGKTFKFEKQRSNHYESQHLKTPSISCEHCGQTFYRNKHFQIHNIWHRHPGFRPFTCELCPTRRFKMREHVRVHWRTHTPEEQAYLKDFGIRKEEVDEFRAVYLKQKEPNPECYEKTKDGGILLGKKLQGKELSSKI